MNKLGITGTWARRVAIGMVVVVALGSRLAAPWHMGVTNDEMHHLESWRNRYGTDDIYPTFIQRLESTGRLRGDRLQLLKRIYASSSIVQRGIIVLVDPQPPLYPVMAEVIEAVSHSSLVALRIPSVIASLGTILLMFLVGKALKDRLLGIWLASLMAIGGLTQIYAGIGRPYALAQCAVVGCIYAFILTRQRKPASPWALLLVALFAQSTQWMAWAVVGPLVLSELLCRLREGTSAWRLLKQVSWYAVFSLLLLMEMVVQLKNPTIAGQAGSQSAGMLWKLFAISSPFLHLASLRTWGFDTGGIVFAALAACGVGYVLHGPSEEPGLAAVRWPLLACLACSIGAMVFVGASPRFMMTYAVAPTLFAGIGARALLRCPAASGWSVAAVTALFGVLTFAHPEDPYDRIFPETPWEPVARTLASEMKPGDVWMSLPYFWANCLYRSRLLPAPLLPQSRQECVEFIRNRPPHAACFVLTETDDKGTILNDPVLGKGVQVTPFRNGHVLLRLPPVQPE